MIAPVPYMGEDKTSAYCTSKGISFSVPYDSPNSADAILNYIGSESYYKNREKRLEEWYSIDKESNIIDEIISVHEPS